MTLRRTLQIRKMAEENINLGSKKAHCSSCSRETNCDIRGKARKSEEDADVWFNRNWVLLQCKGCDSVFIQTIDTNSQDYNEYYDESGELQYELDETIGYWPEKPLRRMPNFVIDAPNSGNLETCLYELYSAFNNQLHVLTGIGIRTCFDAASACLGINPALGFEAKLNSLMDAGLIEAKERTLLDVVIDAGSAAAHRGWEPSSSELESMMDVLEHFLDKAFQQPTREKKMREGILKMRDIIPPKPDRKH